MNQLKKIFFACFFLCALSSFAQNEQPEMVEKEIEEKPVIEIEPEVLAPAPTTERVVFNVVEEMPRFKGCEEIVGDKHGRQSCAQKKMLEFLYGNLKYPPEARANGTEGMVIIKFVVETDGSLTNIEVVRNIGDGCGEAAKSVVEAMPAWIPGKQRGKEVPVYFNLPIKFKLEKMPLKPTAKETIEKTEEEPKKKKKRKKKKRKDLE